MHVNARAGDYISKKEFTGVQSRGLKWENKTYKLKRSISGLNARTKAVNGGARAREGRLMPWEIFVKGHLTELFPIILRVTFMMMILGST